MLISFVISPQSRLDRLESTINSILNQTNNAFEIILIIDSKTTTDQIKQYLDNLFDNNKNIIISENNRSQETSQEWNLAIDIANNKYLVFVKEGDLLKPDFVEQINRIVQQKNPDLIQFDSKYTGLLTNVSKNVCLDKNQLYNLEKSYDPFAYVRRLIYSKAFNLEVIKKNNIYFRRKVRFDSLFTFEFLSYAKTFYATDQVLSDHLVSVMKYSALDIINQWPHIMNYFRKIGRYKQLSDQLNYAYYYELCYNFLDLVKLFNNPTLYKKALNQSQEKVTNKLDKFIKQNKTFLENKDPDFTQRMNEFNNYINSELKKIK
ncbi:glycosyltransferase [Mycoplasma putrefaciens]|uniref:Glycosyltransferase n=1 Tax=Mycoplasma putrefaciens (strain ATCC 15718 / NCTC 10155 / C30 KS-1 / KS-1) TaxID=743965 RepID=A0A7U3ZT00_MYCPK|nr:glycosyltransferase [Mycoplasma putrefaciens]AEM68973.1 glycosyltransferase [Mycoplasma putrefaciens KS1]